MYFYNLLTLISLDIQRDSGKNPQVLQLLVCPLVLGPSTRVTGTPGLSFLITCRLHWHFSFRPSNFKALWGLWANPGKVCPFWSSTCLFAQLHKRLTYKSYSHSVWVIQLLKLSWGRGGRLIPNKTVHIGFPKKGGQAKGEGKSKTLELPEQQCGVSD